MATHFSNGVSANGLKTHLKAGIAKRVPVIKKADVYRD